MWKLISVSHYINRLTEKNHMIISVMQIKAFCKIQHPLMTGWKKKKTWHTKNKRGALSTLYRASLKNLQLKTEWFPSAIGNKTRLSLLSSSVQRFNGNCAIRQEKETKGIQIGKKGIKLSSIAADMRICLENHKGSIKELLALISLAKLQKTIVFLYASNEQLELEFF